jgi:hypothetical protein
MAVFISETRPCNFRKWREYAYLLADGEDELHAFAERIGLHRKWFQPLKSHGAAHYDLFGVMITRALLNGATPILIRDYIRAKHAPEAPPC